jgi:hypothetical protein
MMSDNLANATARVRAMPLFQKMVAGARKRKHGQLTEREYILLERAVVATRPYVAGLMLGWYTAHPLSLKRALEVEGVTVRHPKPRRLHRFQLKHSGLARLTELEQKIARNHR